MSTTTDLLRGVAMLVLTLTMSACSCSDTVNPGSSTPPTIAVGMDESPAVTSSILTGRDVALPYSGCPQVGDDLDLKLCGISITAEVTACNHSDGITRLRAETTDGREVFLVSNESSATGAIRGNGTALAISPAAGDQILCQELDLASVPEEKEFNWPIPTDNAATSGGPSHGPSQIDILVLFPEAAVMPVAPGTYVRVPNTPYCGGGDSSADANMRHLQARGLQADLIVTLWPEAIIARVAHRCVNYTASCMPSESDQACIERPLRWMMYGSESASSGTNDEVAELRDATSADVVMMAIPVSYHNGAAITLSESALSDSRDYSAGAYMVVNTTMSHGHYSLHHEFGHLLGLRHDRRWYGPCDSGAKQPGQCNYGSIVYRDDGAGNRHGPPIGRTIMATARVCECAVDSSITERESCALNRVGVYSRDTPLDGMIVGFSCEIGHQEDGYDQNVDASRYVRDAAEIVSAYRKRPGEN